MEQIRKIQISKLNIRNVYLHHRNKKIFDFRIIIDLTEKNKFDGPNVNQLDILDAKAIHD